MSIYVTGDTHRDFKRLNSVNFPEGDNLTRSDCVIVAGDFGLIWDIFPGDNEFFETVLLGKRPFTLLFIDGNHDNHDRLRKLPKKEMFGGTVGKVSDNIFYLRRGEIYTIEDKKFFTFGGALSRDIILYGDIETEKLSDLQFQEDYLKDIPEAPILQKYGFNKNNIPIRYFNNETFDKKVKHTISNGRRTIVIGTHDGLSEILACRLLGISWWSKEVGSAKERQYGLENLKKHGYTVDYIVSHVTSKSVLDEYAKQVLKSSVGYKSIDKNVDPTEAYMDQVYTQTSFKQAYSGHMHDEWDWGKHHILFEKILKIA